MRGRLASLARQHVVGLYKLTTSHPLNYQTELAALLYNNLWIGSWNDSDPHDAQQGLKWYTRNEVLWLIYHFLYSTLQSYGRQAYLANMYKERVMPSLFALAATSVDHGSNHGGSPRFLGTPHQIFSNFCSNEVHGFLCHANVMYTKNLLFDVKNHLPLSDFGYDQYPLRRGR